MEIKKLDTIFVELVKEDSVQDVVANNLKKRMKKAERFDAVLGV